MLARDGEALAGDGQIALGRSQRRARRRDFRIHEAQRALIFSLRLDVIRLRLRAARLVAAWGRKRHLETKAERGRIPS